MKVDPDGLIELSVFISTMLQLMKETELALVTAVVVIADT